MKLNDFVLYHLENKITFYTYFQKDFQWLIIKTYSISLKRNQKHKNRTVEGNKYIRT